MDLMLYEVTIYILTILFVLFDIFILIKIILFFKKANKTIIDWKFMSINIFNFVLSYLLLIITLLILFDPEFFKIRFLSYAYNDGLFVCMIILFVFYFFRYLILLLTINYSCFTITNQKITFLTDELDLKQITEINEKKIFITLKIKNNKDNLKTKSFLKKSKLATIVKTETTKTKAKEQITINN